MGAMGVVSLAEYLNLKPRYLDGTNIGGSSFVAHVSHAAAAIHAGLCEVALILYGSTAASNALAIGTGMGGGRDAGASFVSPYGTDDGGLLRAGRAAPHAALRHDVRAARRDRRHHAASRGPEPEREDAPADHRRRRAREPRDLAAAAPARLLHHQRRRRRAGRDERRARARSAPSGRCSCSAAARRSCHQELGAPDLLTIAAKQSGEQAFRMAGVTPDDIDLCTIYDSFTITVLVDAREPRLLQARRGRSLRRGRAASASAASCR